MAPAPAFDRLALIGVGLIGGSIARAARALGLVRTITATSRSEMTRQRIRELGLVDDIVDTSAAAVAGADLVIVCVPIGACGAVAREIGPHLKPGAIVSDVGSVKADVVREMAPHLPAGVHFIPGHPVAGTEDSGPDAGFAELFINRWCILTPAKDADPSAVERLSQFWKAFGASVEIMSPEHHDLVLAVTSHVPHLIAFNIIGTAFDLRHVTESEILKYSAGGFRDFTRIAASDPTMWRDIFLHNREAVLEVLSRFNEDLSTLTRAVDKGDAETLYNIFAERRAIRRGMIQFNLDSAAPDFRQPESKPKADPMPRPYAASNDD
jgi:cyclohexadieny/prephenate dehydrogenase